jgi:tetratricopeptide (TPR) repeat protein
MRAASEAIAFEPVGEQQLKGKAAPVPAHRALRVVARRGGLGRADRLEAPFVGRDSELRLLKDLFHATARERRVRLVSITGQGGIGKSRLAWELRKYGDGIVEDIWWHQGRSPAYGEGITFWALGEMVRSRAFLAETDDEATTRAKLSESVARFVPAGEERERVDRALQVLLGIGDAPPGGAGELFSAWRTYFEGMATSGLAIMVFEDLHWADQGQLDFIDHVLEWSRNVPILIISLARPELLERRPDWGAGRRNFLALDLGRLDDDAIRELLAGLVANLPEEAARSIVQRAEGIPLYAVETIRMLVSDGRLRERESGGFEPAGELGELAIPGTLHALIAARLDGLDPAERALIQDAAVLGQTFTPAALAAVSGLKPAELEARLRVLVRSDLLREDADPRSPELGHYGFVQALIREVAYSTLALKDRRARHLAAARYFESLGDDELAAALASHYLSAFRATPAGAEADALAAQARIALRAAADRASSLGVPNQALAFLEQALEVTTDDEEQADVLERAGQAALAAAHQGRAEELLVRAQAIREGLGDRAGTARVLTLRGRALFMIPRREAAIALLEPSLPAFDDLSDEPAVVGMVTALAVAYSAVGNYESGLAAARRALAAAERLGLPEPAAQALNALGSMAFYKGRLWEARALTDGALKLARENDLKEVELTVRNSLTAILALDDPRATLDVERETIALARRLGSRTRESVVLGNAAEDARRTGEWAWAIGELEATIGNDMDPSTRLTLDGALGFYAILHGEAEEGLLDSLVVRIRDLDDRDVSSGVHDLQALIAAARSDWAAAAAAWREQATMSDLNKPYALPRAGTAAVLAGDATVARQVLDDLAALGTRGRAIEADRTTIEAGVAATEGDEGASLAKYRTAHAAYRDLGLVWDEALLGLAAATRLGTGNAEVRGWLEAARDTFSRLRAKPFLTQVEALLASAPATTSTARTGARDGAAADQASRSPSRS